MVPFRTIAARVPVRSSHDYCTVESRENLAGDVESIPWIPYSTHNTRASPNLRGS